MRLALIFLIFLIVIVLPAFAQRGNPVTPEGGTSPSSVADANATSDSLATRLGNGGVLPPDNATLTPSLTATIPLPAEFPFAPKALPFPTLDLSPIAVTPETQPAFTETHTLTPVSTLVATDTSMAEPSTMEPIDPTEEVSAPPLPTDTVDVTATVSASATSVTCLFDTDTDGEVTERDLSQLAELLNTSANETTAVYDLNANTQIDIGDLQIMASRLHELCHA